MYDPWLASGLALACWLLLSFAIERLVNPAPRFRDRPPAAWLIHTASALLCFAFALAASGRPVLAAGVSISLWSLLIAVNNAKVRALREPFVFSDFALFSQALRFPRLYLPFLDRPRAFGGAAVAVTGVLIGLWTEPSLPSRIGLEAFLWLLVVGLVTGGALLSQGLRHSPRSRFEPEREVARDGLVTTLWLYCLAESAPLPLRPAASAFEHVALTGRRSGANALPNLIVVQSESFFDARRLLPSIRPEILRGYDRVKRDSLAGRLSVPAWGANTMRTEFAFLSGLPVEQLGVHRFNPYRRYALQPLNGLANVLRAQGYRTACIHPHPIGFFGRDRVFPNLGFDRFIDIQGFIGAEQCGPYVSDAAVGAKIAEVLAEERAPVFLFVITMENHGPLHLERATAADVAALYSSAPPDGFDDLTVYLRHLANADRMLSDLVKTLQHGERDSLLCFFGDHVPSMPGVYNQLRFDDARSDYLIWRRGLEQRREQDLAVDALGLTLLDCAGITGGSVDWRRERASPGT